MRVTREDRPAILLVYVNPVSTYSHIVRDDCSRDGLGELPAGDRIALKTDASAGCVVNLSQRYERGEAARKIVAAIPDVEKFSAHIE